MYNATRPACRTDREKQAVRGRLRKAVREFHTASIILYIESCRLSEPGYSGLKSTDQVMAQVIIDKIWALNLHLMGRIENE